MIDTVYTIEIHDDLDSAPHPLPPPIFKIVRRWIID